MKHGGMVFTRLYRYLFREDIYAAAFQNLYANDGALTKGSNDDTADGFSVEYVQDLIAKLREGTYKATPVRRVYIKKPNGKYRPLGIPSFTDKLLQEAVRMILESIYEPVFSPRSHGFRPNKSCHTAFEEMKKTFCGVPWVIEGDIAACFDSIDHKMLLSILGEKINDCRFLHVIREFLKAGYIEDWRYHETYSGCPQGGIVSPILANIYLSKLDVKIEQMAVEFVGGKETSQRRQVSPEYMKLNNKCKWLRKEIGTALPGPARDALVKELHGAEQELRRTPCTIHADKKIAYIRYADDWLIGVRGSKEDCKAIKKEIADFLKESLKLELSETKTLITHSSNKIRFLGYDISVRRCQVVKRYKNKFGKWIKRRTLNGSVNLEVPLEDKIRAFLFRKEAIIQMPDGSLRPRHRRMLVGKPDAEIVKTYNSEVRGILNFYGMASNYYKLQYFCYLMEQSCLFTLAFKHKTSCRKFKREHWDGMRWSIPSPTKKNKDNRVAFVDFSTYMPPRKPSDTIKEFWHYSWKSTIWTRLKRDVCECCTVRMKPNEGVVHVVKRLKDLGDTPWGRVMKYMRRKTLIVCPACRTLILSAKKVMV
jgi:retron-type reverse transcriptase